MRRVLAFAALLAASGLSACASDQSLTDRLAGSRVDGDEGGVSVAAGSAAEAFPLAVGHCAHFGKSAQFARKLDDGHYRFNCEKG
jgi:hypothetical protein